MASLRHKLGALVYDWPRFLGALRGRSRWVRMRNRNERITLDPNGRGVRCEWEFGSDLHIANIYPFTARWLMNRALSEWPIEERDEPCTAGEPRVSFVIGHRGSERVPLLLKTLRTIAAQDVAVECVVVEQSARPQLQLPSWVRTIHTPIDSDALPYNRAAAFNAGARAASASVLVLHDNDTLVPAAYAREAIARIERGAEIADIKRFIFYLDEHGAPEVVTQNLHGGSIVAAREAYFAIGGFDESFVGWGGEDNDFWERAQTRRVDAFGSLPLVHLWHAPQKEKAMSEATGGRRRYLEMREVPVAERIARLRSQESGRIER